MLKLVKSVVFTMLLATIVMAQSYTVTGKVVSAENNEALAFANVFVKGMNTGAATDANGEFSFELKKGTYTIVCSYIGYESKEAVVEVKGNTEVNFELADFEYSLSVTVMADRAKERETPVAYTNISKEEMVQKLGSQDIPMVLNTTPSVYATMQGGGAGDARINIRGFNQRNVAIMINGIPVNDMENGWVYWSNWDGVGDATSSIQVQRGLSAINLATPSVGGTMNIITDPTAQKQGVMYKTEMGSGQFAKSTVFANTGLVDGKWAVSVAGVRKTGNGVIDATWTDAWAYYFGASYQINKNNRLELYAMGAPQRHGQNLYKQNIATYDHDYARDLDDYDNGGLDAFAESQAGRLYNQTWNHVSSSYNGKQYFNGTTHNRYDNTFINERENFYHKPLASLNWYSNLSKKVSLYTTFYYSGGEGGGSGTKGSLVWDYSGPSRIADWDATIARNAASDTSTGILRNSVNSQWTIGAISKAFIKVNKQLTLSAGVDWRTAEIRHFREVRDLLGGSVFIDDANAFDVTDASHEKRLGDKVEYYNTNTVDWFGLYGQAEYSADKFTVYGMAGWSMIKYTFVDHFKKGANGGELELDPDAISGYQFKGGAKFRTSKNSDVFFNAGYVSKAPIFDAIIDDSNSELIADPKNETFISFELGSNVWLLENKMNLKLNGYYTTWNDRSQNSSYDIEDPTDDEEYEARTYVTGMDQTNMGIEFEMAYRPISFVRFDASASYGIWEYTDDVSFRYNYVRNNGDRVDGTSTLTIKDVKVGDAPQTQFSVAATVYPLDGLSMTANYRYYTSHYAEFDPFSRQKNTVTGAEDREQSWETPSYGLLDFHVYYDVPVKVSGLDLKLFAHVFNALDEIYIQDAVDNSSYNAYSGNGKNHKADDAEVYLGIPATYNLGIQVGL